MITMKRTKEQNRTLKAKIISVIKTCATRAKSTWLICLAISLLISVTLFIAGPTELYFGNINDFIFTYAQMMLTMLPYALMLFTGSFLLLFIIGLSLPKRIFRVIAAFLFGIAIAMYVQGNILSMFLQGIDGEAVVWQSMLPTILIGLGIWGAIILLSLILNAVFEKSYTQITIFLCFTLVVMQTAAGVTGYINTDGGNPSTITYMSNQGNYTVSSNNNVIVFMVDTVDTRYFDELIATAPEYLEPFDGFTYYRNMGGMYRKTAGAVTYFMTGERYLNQMPFTDFCTTYLRDCPMLASLKRDNYDVRFSCTSTYNGAFSAEQIDNIREADVSITDKGLFTETFIKLIAYRYAPTVCQPFIFCDFNGLFREVTSVGYSARQTPIRDYRLYEQMRNYGIKLMDNDKNAFRLFCLSSAHGPYNTGADGNRHPDGIGTCMESIKGSFTIIGYYIDRMKELGIYDQSTIIVFADHGYDEVNSPMYIMKKPNEHGVLTISNAPVCHEDLRATFLKAAGCSDYHDFGIPVDEWPEDAERTRYFYAYWFTTVKRHNMYFLPITEYVYTGHATDISAYKKTGNVYVAK